MSLYLYRFLFQYLSQGITTHLAKITTPYKQHYLINKIGGLIWRFHTHLSFHRHGFAGVLHLWLTAKQVRLVKI
jgi:hypothetical protein